jgi:hypothetical protein
MDLITHALVAALAKLAEPAVKDAYEALKGALARKLGAHSEASKAIQTLETKPESPGRQQTLAEEMRSSGATSDEELIQLAQALASAVQGKTTGQATVYQRVEGDHNLVTGTGDINIDNSSGHSHAPRRPPRPR